MDKRHSSFSRAESPRPRVHLYRKRSNSFPISEALGCSTPEAELILAEGRAAVRRRSEQQRGRKRRDDIPTFRPSDHIGYLVQGSKMSEPEAAGSLFPPASRISRHTRTPSNTTDRSTSTIVAPDQPSVEETFNNPNPHTSSLGDYSAHLAKFIQSQLNLIPTYTASTAISPRSCPDLSFPRSPPLSPAKPVPMRRHVGAPNLIEIPGVRPPARSAFSAWSSTDDEADEEVPPTPDAEVRYPNSQPATYTSSVFRYYEQNNDSTFLFTSTPADANEEPDKTNGFPFSDLRETGTEPNEGNPLSAGSFSSSSVGSYFEEEMDMKDGIITPPAGKVIPTISPFEGAALANVHDMLVQSQQRVLVDGLSFDMVQGFPMSGQGARHFQTPC